MENVTPWLLYLTHYFGGAFAANAFPHLSAGILGQPLQTPFASPPFKGLSSPQVNVVWASVNIFAAHWKAGVDTYTAGWFR